MTLRQWFAPPQFKDEYEAFAAQVLHFALLTLTCVTVAFIFVISSPSQLIPIPVILALLAVCYFLLRRKRLYLASMLFVSVSWLVVTLASFEITSISTASVDAYVIVIIVAAILLPGPEMIMFTGISIASSIILHLGDAHDIIALHPTPEYVRDHFFLQLALLVATGFLLWAASRMLRRNLLRIRKHEETLLQRNQDLEQEIAERRRTEANLRISEEKYRLMFENLPMIGAVYGQDGEIILINKVAAELFSGTKESIQGHNFREFLLSDAAESGLASHALAMKEGRTVFRECKVMLPNGKEVTLLRHIIPLPNPDQSPSSQVLVLTTDLTEKYLAEERERELVQARERNTFLTEFFSTLSHDIKTPLTVINTTLYLLRRSVTEEEREQRLTRISEHVSLMDKYIQDMLTISKLEHIPTIHFAKINLNSLIEEVVGTLRPRLEGKRIQFQFFSQPNLPALQGDEEQLRRMLTNLVENAVNYTPVGGTVAVKTCLEDQRVVLRVIDSGIGIDAEAIPRIFERFFRASNATAFERRGTGLGLAIVKKIADTHSATIDVDSRVGEGTTFTVQFAAQPAAETCQFGSA